MANTHGDLKTDRELTSVYVLPQKTRSDSGASAKPVHTRPLVLTQQHRVGQADVLHLTTDQRVMPGRTAHRDPRGRMPARAGSNVSDLIAKITALESAIAHTSEHWEPERAGEGPYAGTEPPTMTWPELIATEARAAVLSTITQQPASPDSAVDDPAETQPPDVADREALREIIAQVVREELQGALGAQLTHRLRLMVRRELDRALALRDADQD